MQGERPSPVAAYLGPKYGYSPESAPGWFAAAIPSTPIRVDSGGDETQVIRA